MKRKVNQARHKNTDKDFMRVRMIDAQFDSDGVLYSGKLAREQQAQYKKRSLKGAQAPLSEEQLLKRKQEVLSKDPTATFGTIGVTGMKPWRKY